jgi:hypothetical protein
MDGRLGHGSATRALSGRPGPRTPSAVPRAPRTRRPLRGDIRSDATAAFSRRRRTSLPRIRWRLTPALVTLIVSLVLFALNLRKVTLLDALPIAWTWLVLYLIWSVGAELFERAFRQRRPRRPT